MFIERCYSYFCYIQCPREFVVGFGSTCTGTAFGIISGYTPSYFNMVFRNISFFANNLKYRCLRHRYFIQRMFNVNRKYPMINYDQFKSNKFMRLIHSFNIYFEFSMFIKPFHSHFDTPCVQFMFIRKQENN